MPFPTPRPLRDAAHAVLQSLIVEIEQKARTRNNHTPSLFRWGRLRFDWTITEKYMRIIWIDQIHDHITQDFPVDWFGCVVGEACSRRVSAAFRHDIGRQGDNWHRRVFLIFLPLADLATGHVAILDWHLNIALEQDRHVSSVQAA